MMDENEVLQPYIKQAVGLTDVAKTLGRWLAGLGVESAPLAQRALGGIGAKETAGRLGRAASINLARPESPAAHKVMRNLGLGTLGAGGLGVYGGYRGIRSLIGGEEELPKKKENVKMSAEKQAGPTKEEKSEKKEAQLGTAFTDGLLQFCLDRNFSGEQVADLLEKGAQAGGWVGQECQGFLDRMVK